MIKETSELDSLLLTLDAIYLFLHFLSHSSKFTKFLVNSFGSPMFFLRSSILFVLWYSVELLLKTYFLSIDVCVVCNSILQRAAHLFPQQPFPSGICFLFVWRSFGLHSMLLDLGLVFFLDLVPKFGWSEEGQIIWQFAV